MPVAALPCAIQSPVPNWEDPRATWTYLQAIVSRIMFRLDEGMDMKTYMDAYGAVHSHCTSHKFELAAHTPRGARLIGEELYGQLSVYLEQHLNDLVQQSNDHSDDALLTFFTRQWDRYTKAAKCINSIFSFLNRNWLRNEMREGRNDVYEVHMLHLVQWDTVLLPEVQERVKFAAWKMVVTHRNGRTIDHPKIKQIVDSFTIPRHPVSPSSKGARVVYLVTQQLDRVTRKKTTTVAGSPNNTLWSKVPSLHHWGVLVAPKDNLPQGLVFEVSVPRNRIKPGRIRFDEKRWNQRFKAGYTFLSDDEIEQLANIVVNKTGTDYRLLSNNCQRFCTLLCPYILMPTQPDKVFEGIQDLPFGLGVTMASRRSRYYEEYSSAELPTPMPMPIPIRKVGLVILGTIYTILMGCIPNIWLLILLILAVGFSTLYAGINILSLWPRCTPGTENDSLYCIYRSCRTDLNNDVEWGSIIDAGTGWRKRCHRCQGVGHLAWNCKEPMRCDQAVDSL